MLNSLSVVMTVREKERGPTVVRSRAPDTVEGFRRETATVLLTAEMELLGRLARQVSHWQLRSADDARREAGLIALGAADVAVRRIVPEALRAHAPEAASGLSATRVRDRSAARGAHRALQRLLATVSRAAVRAVIDAALALLEHAAGNTPEPAASGQALGRVVKTALAVEGTDRAAILRPVLPVRQSP